MVIPCRFILLPHPCDEKFMKLQADERRKGFFDETAFSTCISNPRNYIHHSSSNAQWARVISLKFTYILYLSVCISICPVSCPSPSRESGYQEQGVHVIHQSTSCSGSHRLICGVINFDLGILGRWNPAWVVLNYCELQRGFECNLEKTSKTEFFKDYQNSTSPISGLYKNSQSTSACFFQTAWETMLWPINHIHEEK